MTRIELPAAAHKAVRTALQSARARRDVFLQVTPALAQRDVERASSNNGPLAGVPFAVKDVFDVAGTRTSAASQMYDASRPASIDAVAVQRLRKAGMVIIGKTTMSELAYSGLGHNTRFGTPVIYRDGEQYLVGGSSSGSAAAVQAGIVPVALASDTSGSARIPAAWAGVLGFRPSMGRYNTSGMLPLAPTLDTVGVIARSPTLLRAVDDVLAEPTAPADRSRQGPMEFAVPDEDQLGDNEPWILEKYFAVVERLRTAGIRVSQSRFQSLDIVRLLNSENLPIVEAEALAQFGDILEHRPDTFTGAVQRRLRRANERSASRSATPLYREMQKLRSSFRTELNGRLLLTPPAEIGPPRLADIKSSADREDELNARALRTTMMLSYLGAPSVVVPVQAVEAGTTVLVSGDHGSDRQVLAAAEAIHHVLGIAPAALP